MSADLNRPLSHHSPPTGLDALALPQITTSRLPTDEYTMRTKQGFIPSSVEDAEIRAEGLRRQESHRVRVSPSPTPTAVSTDVEKGGKEWKLVTFTEHDPEDPRQLSFARKWFVTVLMSINCFICVLGSSVIVMDQEVQAEALGCSIDVIHLTATLFVLAFGVGPMFLAPLSEQFGRRPVLIGSMVFYFAFAFASAFAQNAATMLAGRMLSGLGASAPLVLTGGVLANVWDEKDRGIPLALFSQTLFLGPTLGPVIGGYLAGAGWRWNYYLIIIVSGLLLIADVFFLPETTPSTILQHRAARLRKETGDDSYVTEQERHRLPLGSIVYNALVVPIQLFVTEPIMICMTAYLSLIYGLLYLLFFAVPIVAALHNFSRGSVGLSFIPILLGMLAVNGTVMIWQTKFYSRKSAAYSAQGLPTPPEDRLPSMMICAPILPIALFIFAWTSYPSVHWIAPMIGSFLFGYAMLGIYIGANSYIVDSFPMFASAAMASKTLFSRAVGAAMPMFVDRWYHSSAGPRWPSCILGIIAVLMMPIPFLFFKYGAQIRASSKRSG